MKSEEVAQLFRLEPITITGYHGTRLDAVDGILNEGFRPSKNDWDWLGHGIYFWQDAPYRAESWARLWLRRQGYEGPVAVVQPRFGWTDS